MKALLFAAALAAAPALSWADTAGFRREGNIEWACGGVGADERRVLAMLGTQANLEVVMATAQRGGYVAGVELALHAASGTAALWHQPAEGPICFFKVPPGAYRVEARLAGVQRQARVLVAPGRPTRVVLTFPDEPWDGVSASEEEKRQARER